jgi:hypothetical protein
LFPLVFLSNKNTYHKAMIYYSSSTNLENRDLMVVQIRQAVGRITNRELFIPV